MFYDTIGELVGLLRNKQLLEDVRQNIMRHRMEFTFDGHIEEIERFFSEVIKGYGEK